MSDHSRQEITGKRRPAARLGSEARARLLLAFLIATSADIVAACGVVVGARPTDGPNLPVRSLVPEAAPSAIRGRR